MQWSNLMHSHPESTSKIDQAEGTRRYRPWASRQYLRRKRSSQARETHQEGWSWTEHHWYAWSVRSDFENLGKEETEESGYDMTSQANKVSTTTTDQDVELNIHQSSTAVIGLAIGLLIIRKVPETVMGVESWLSYIKLVAKMWSEMNVVWVPFEFAWSYCSCLRVLISIWFSVI